MEEIANPERRPHIYSQRILTRATRPFNEKQQSFNKQCWENCASACKTVRMDSYLLPHSKLNSEVIKDQNTRPKTEKLLEETTGGNLLDIGLGYDFLDIIPKT